MQRVIVEALGSVAGALTTLSFLPQVFKVLRERRADGISRGMYAVFMLGVFLWVLYGMFIGSGPIIAANFITFLLAGIVLVMKLRIDGLR
jgi:MtN3 and saliva related transmembrane protein